MSGFTIPLDTEVASHKQLVNLLHLMATAFRKQPIDFMESPPTADNCSSYVFPKTTQQDNLIQLTAMKRNSYRKLLRPPLTTKYNVACFPSLLPIASPPLIRNAC